MIMVMMRDVNRQPKQRSWGIRRPSFPAVATLVRLGGRHLSHPLDRMIAGLTIPALGALAIEPVFLMSDSAIVGHLGPAELAGLGIGSGILLNLVNLCLFLTFATTSSIARQAAAGNREAAAAQAVDGSWLALIIGLGLAVALGVASHSLTDLFGSGPAELHYARLYLDISLAGIPGM